MSFDKAKSALSMFEVGLHALETVQKLTRVGGDKAAAALAAIDAVVASVLDGWSGKVTPAAVQAELKALEKDLTSNDENADAALHKKFDHSGEG